MSAAFDTIAAVRRLEESGGLTRDAAEAITASDLEALTADRDGLATKADLAVLRADLAELRADLVDRMQANERRTYAAVFTAAGVIVAVLKFLPPA